MGEKFTPIKPVIRLIMKNYSSKIIYGGFYSPPFMYNDEQNTLRGPLIDLAILLAEHFACSPVFQTLSQSQLNDFNNSDIDIGLGIFETSLRSKLGKFSRPFFKLRLQGLGVIDYRASDLNQLKHQQLIFGVKEGDIGHDYLINLYGTDWVKDHCVVIPPGSSRDSWELLENHECDIVLCDALTLTNRKKEIPLQTYMVFTQPLHDIDMGFLVNTKSPISETQVTDWLYWFMKSNSYAEYINKICYGYDQTVLEPY